MKFTELKKIFEDRLGIVTLADIARELNVTPQVVNNWKSRDIVPYKYVHSLKLLIEKESKSANEKDLKDASINQTEMANEDDEFSIEDFIKLAIPYFQLIIKNIKYLIIIPLIIFFVAYSYLRFFADPVFISHAQILPLGNQSSKISKAAKTFGLQVGNNKEENLSSASMFPAILNSRMFAKKMMTAIVSVGSSGKGDYLINLINGSQIIKKNNIDSIDNIGLFEKHQFVGNFRAMLNVERNKKQSSLLDLSVSSNNPIFSKNILASVLNKLQIIVIDLKLSLAKEKKDFIASRIKDINSELVVAEENLKIFREKNRSIFDSPSLLLEMDRLAREVAALQQISVTLRSEFEMVQIDIIERGSRIQILDSPEIPLSQSSPRYLYTSAISSIISLLIILCIIFIKPIINENLYLFYLFYKSND